MPARASRRLGIVRDHDDRLAELAVEPVEQVEDLLRRRAVEVAGRLVGDDDRRVGDQRPRDRDALLLPAGELVRDSDPCGRSGRRAPARSHALSPLAPRSDVSSSGSSTFSKAVSTGIRL